MAIARRRRGVLGVLDGQSNRRRAKNRVRFVALDVFFFEKKRKKKKKTEFFSFLKRMAKLDKTNMFQNAPKSDEPWNRHSSPQP